MNRHLGLLLALPALLPFPADAAESYDNCTGFIDTVPAVIATQGTWCLRKDLSTAITSGRAVEIATNNVTIDCNDFKIGGLAAGPGTAAHGIFATGKSNITVSNCNIRGFAHGIHIIDAGGGHAIEDNRLDANTISGVEVHGDGSVVQRNLVLDTGSSAQGAQGATGIAVRQSVDVIDNTIVGVNSGGDDAGVSIAAGITSHDSNGSIRGNRVRGLASTGTEMALAYGIYVNRFRPTLRDNDLVGPGSWGLYCTDANLVHTKGNIINGFIGGTVQCIDDGNVLVFP